MRDIKFRAVSIKTNEFVYGLLHFNAAESSLQIVEFVQHGPTQCEPAGGQYNVFHNVKPETVSQFTGLRDINGVECYENNIAVVNGKKCVVKFNEYFICGWEFNIINGIGCYAFKDVVKNLKGADFRCTNFEIIGDFNLNS